MYFYNQYQFYSKALENFYNNVKNFTIGFQYQILEYTFLYIFVHTNTKTHPIFAYSQRNSCVHTCTLYKGSAPSIEQETAEVVRGYTSRGLGVRALDQ